MANSFCRTNEKVFILLLAFLFLFLSACSEKDEAEVIRQRIQKGAELAEQKKVGDLMAMTTDGFIADPGGNDPRAVKGILLRAFMYYGQFKLHFPKPTVEMADDGLSAAATLHFLIVRQNQTIPGLKDLYDDPRKWLETVGEKADLYQLEMSWVKTDGDWLVVSAKMAGFKGTVYML